MSSISVTNSLPATGFQSAATARSHPGSATPADPRLDKAAHQFEAMLLGELLKPLETAKQDEQSNDGEGSLTGGSASGPLETFGMQAVAESLANSGALGFARQIQSALARRTSVSTSGDTV